MKSLLFLRALALALSAFTTVPSMADIGSRRDVGAFIDEMVEKHQFDPNALRVLFGKVQIQESILTAISRPAEAKPWHQYRELFLTPARIHGGVKFMGENRSTLAEVERRFGVPAEIIVAIIGVETSYGANTGSYRVIDALSTLSFDYPKRSPFFRKELENFLLLCREENIDPAQPKGSYAGAMGVPQFMPSSFRHYAADFEGDNKRDIWNNRKDAIASVANYFVQHGWQTGEAVAYRVNVTGSKADGLLNSELEPGLGTTELKKAGVKVPGAVAPDAKLKLLKLDGAQGPEYWLGLHNFYVITRYNRSPLYAMAVYQLSRKIRNNRK